MNKYLLILLLLVLKVQGQCTSVYGTITVSEVYFDTRYHEDIEAKYHSFGEYIELYNSSTEAVDLNGWTIKDNHTSFTITNTNTYLNNQTIIQPGGFKIITYNGFYAPGFGQASAIGGRQKFKELFGFADDYPEQDIILQDQMVLYNDVDIVRLYTPQSILVDEVSYLNESTVKPNPKDYLKIQNYDITINPRIDNSSGGFFNGPIGVYSIYIPYPFPGTTQYIQTTQYSDAITRSQVNDYYSHSGKTIQVATATPMALPTGIVVPLKPLDPYLYYNPLNSSNFNSTEAVSYDIKSGLENGHSKVYYDDFGKATVAISQDYKNSLFWGTETVYDSFGRKSKESYLAPSCFGMDKVNFLSNPIIKYNVLDNYYSDDNIYEEYQATAEQPYSEINYDKLNSDNVINVVGGNTITENGSPVWKTGYSFTVPAAQEMYYVYGRDYYDGPVEPSGDEEIITKFFKTVSVDANGIENVVFSDGEGKTLATAHTGDNTTPSYPVMSLIGTQGYIDVHIPSGTAGASFVGTTSASDYTIYDLKTGGLAVTPLAPGNAYRVVANVTPMADPKVYVTNSGDLVASPGAFGVTYDVNYYDYAVNVYNKTGLLINSIQPNGISLNTTILPQPTYMTSVASDFITSYSYDSMSQINETTTPDSGTGKLAYRKDGKIRYSQNLLQSDTKISYTNYDEFQRPIESGVITGSIGIWTLATGNSYGADNQNLVAGTRSEQTFTIYDFAANNNTTLSNAVFSSIPVLPSGYVQHNLSGNIAMSFKSDDGGMTVNSITWHSYDIYGRIEWIVQYSNTIGIKTLDYVYDYQNNIRQVIYQRNNINNERFIHQYTYDANNILTLIETASGTNPFTVDAEYSYYKTGELKRTNIAQGAQGLDYIYTLGGNLKSINHPSLDHNRDPGRDGIVIPGQPTTAGDLFGLSLDYYYGDYQRLNSQGLNNFQTAFTTGNDYVGNIKAVRWANNSLDVSSGMVNPKAYQFEFNSKNWLKNAYFRNSDAFGNITPLSGIPNANLEGDLQYDSNGNIRNLKRANSSGSLIDKLSYSYGNGNNQLSSVSDVVNNPANVNDFNPMLQGISSFTYNAIGQLIHDSEQNLDYFYNTQGLVTEIKRNTNPLVKFYYNERGQRIRKESFTNASNDYYVLDLSGNVMSVYTQGATTPLQQKEMPIYGGTRLGICFKGILGNPDIRNYEITDHLGNVRAIVQKVSGTPYVTMVSYADYYPFGEQLDGRSSTSSNYYRYAYQGQELDKETGKEAFNLRLWDGRIGRWLSPDPNGQYFSPYLGMGNNPIMRIDLDGGWDFYRDKTTDIIYFFADDTGEIDGYEHLGASYSMTNADGIVTAFGESRFGDIVQWNIGWIDNGLNGYYYQVDGPIVYTKPSNNNLAAKILASGRFEFATRHVGPQQPDDLANADDNIRDAAQGRMVYTSTYGDAKGKQVYLDQKLLKALYTLSKDYTITVSEFAGGDHSSTSGHYKGKGVDITVINGSHVSSNNTYYKDFMKDAKGLGGIQVLGPGDANHGGHVHFLVK